MKFVISGSGQKSTVALSGAIDEMVKVSLASIPSKIAQGSVCFSLAGVSEINSIGARLWSLFIADLAKHHDVSFSDCPPVIVEYMCMLPAFVKNAAIESILIPYECGTCGAEIREKFAVPVTQEDVNRKKACNKCGEAMPCAVDTEDYLLFQKYASPVIAR